jgi:inositol-phosphate phosphatase/L-galactose 1-phosphate phosphatase/histidinol-phosphatase
MQDLLSFVNHLADEAGAIITRYYRTDFDVEAKGDESPVTVADRTVEAALRKIIEATRPEDGILGEEYGAKEGRSGYTWVLDPIDGTKSFTIGRPSFGTLIAYCKDDVPMLGAIDQPILKERWVGDGRLTTFNGKAVRARACKDLKLARLASTSPSQLVSGVSPHPNLPPLKVGKALSPSPPHSLRGEDLGGGQQNSSDHLWQRLYKECNYMVWGGDCYSYGLLANGWLDGVVEQFLAPYDFAALVPVVKGAGGWMSDWQGNPLTLKSNGQTLAVGDVGLRDRVLKILSS